MVCCHVDVWFLRSSTYVIHAVLRCQVRFRGFISNRSGKLNLFFLLAQKHSTLHGALGSPHPCYFKSFLSCLFCSWGFDRPHSHFRFGFSFSKEDSIKLGSGLGRWLARCEEHLRCESPGLESKHPHQAWGNPVTPKARREVETEESPTRKSWPI